MDIMELFLLGVFLRVESKILKYIITPMNLEPNPFFGYPTAKIIASIVFIGLLLLAVGIMKNKRDKRRGTA